tara:strand:- start:5809 stop:6987 length:1179 start_codon:yes stop_codon:yes gene_type:complete
MKNKKLITHVTLTPLAGSPIRISDALNKHSRYESRCINLNPLGNGKRTFKEDLVWSLDKEECFIRLSKSDIVCFHHYIDYKSPNNPFKVNFLDFSGPNTKFIFHWHSNPNFISETRKIELDKLLNIKDPQLVVAQFHETYFPNALPVPLIVEKANEVTPTNSKLKPIIFFSPSNDRMAFERRWESKARNQVLAILKKLKRDGVANYILAEDLPFDHCNQLRAESDIVIDDVVTGSFHTSSLEALALGKPTISYLDHRTQLVLSETTGSTDLPIINAKLEYLEEVLLDLCNSSTLRESLGAFSLDWFNTHYSEKKMTEIYARAFEKILAGKETLNPRYKDHKNAKIWLYKNVVDIEWSHRKMKFYGEVSNLAYYYSYKLLKKLKMRLNELLRG